MVPCTIVIPTHNRDDLLVRAVQSALQACPAGGEVLVVDDKSIIPATQVLAAETDPRLRVIVNTGPSGASSTRNLGVASAVGDVIFFLDDDDELITGYCCRVLDAVVTHSAECRWGFSSTIERRDDADSIRTRKRLKQGPVSLSARPKDLVAAMSDGFWIQRQLFLEAGGLDIEQIIDEDTDLCVRLIAQELRPWHHAEPGTVVYRGYVPARTAGAQLTLGTSSQKGLLCYRRTHDKNVTRFGAFSAMRWYLATRYIRRAVKAGQGEAVMKFVHLQKPWPVFCLLASFAYIKRLIHR